MLERLGVVGARLRWPNDLMVNDRKLAGLLIEQGGHETLSVGLGLNITNEPWKDDPALKGIACSLAEFLKPVPSPEEMAAHVLDAISEAHATLEMTGLKPTIESLNQLWKPCAVTVHLHEGDSITGVFRGLDRTGNLEISNSFGERVVILHQNVKQLVEKE
jgi:BirA family biotin operon repressor/biotin-[acetyl-CoA-carboxylase] ligase